MLSFCGKTVHYLCVDGGVVCGVIYTGLKHFSAIRPEYWVKVPKVSHLPHLLLTGFSTIKKECFNLIEHYLYPFSTAPIISITK